MLKAIELIPSNHVKMLKKISSELLSRNNGGGGGGGLETIYKEYLGGRQLLVSSLSRLPVGPGPEAAHSPRPRREFDFQLKYLVSLKNLAKIAVVFEKYTKLIERNLKMIMSIKNM